MSESPPRPEPPPTRPPFWMRLWWLPLVLLLALQTCPGLFDAAGRRRLPYSEFTTLLSQGQIARVDIDPSEIRGMLRPAPPTPGKATTDSVPFITSRVEHPALFDELRRHNVVVYGTVGSRAVQTLMGWLLPMALLFGLWWLILRRGVMQPTQGLFGMGESRARVYAEKETKVTFADVAGVDEAKRELREIVDFLRDPTAFGRLGARMPRGVLLVGGPGTGKTLLARAVAGEAGVPFYFINGSEFVELFVGVGAARVRSLFEKARANAPCILFIDEIDALGKARGRSVVSGANDEKEQTLNQLLAELDGFSPERGVVLLAATNRPDTLDPALLRAGRFDRQILIDRPDRKGRQQILAVHASRVRAAPGLDLDAVAGMTPGFTGADLANLVNEAALVATRRRATEVTLDDFSAAIERLVAGLSRESRIMSDQDRARTACHEMGHALVSLATPGSDPVQKVSIIPRAIGALGYTMQRPIEDRYLATVEELDGKLTVLMGGRAAELVVFGDLSTGAADDLAKATALSTEMVARFGMDETVGHAVYADVGTPLLSGADGPPLVARVSSEATLREVDLAVRSRVEAALDRAVHLLHTDRAALDAGRQLLSERETLGAEELAAVRQAQVSCGNSVAGGSR